MPKVKSNSSSKIRAFVAEFPEIFKIDSDILFCKCCNIRVNHDQRGTVLQHLNTNKHKENSAKTSSAQQSLLTTQLGSTSRKSEFNFDLAKALLSADIPFWKLQNDNFRIFLKKYTNHKIPDESTLRKNYVSDIYDDFLSKMRSFLHEKKIWVSIDETTDTEGRYIASVIVGVLSEDKEESAKSFVLTIEELPKTNHQTIAKCFNDSMNLIWPSGIKYDNVLLFVSDAAPYMLKAGKAIQIFYPKMIHVTCMAHGMHRLAETVRTEFKEINNLISSVKTIFFKAPRRVQLFKEMNPGLPLPPQPIVTRWGTWLSAAFYYAENLQSIEQTINCFDEDESVAIGEAKQLLKLKTIKNDLAYISSNFKKIATTIENLEKKNVALTSNLELILSFRLELKSCPGKIGEEINRKFEAVLKKKPGYSILQRIKNKLLGIEEKEEENEDFEILNALSPSDISKFKYAPITSCDVERSFSQYKALFRENRQSFTFDHLKKTFICSVNKVL